ncbi:hypothetical protein [Streptomyces lomondensis]|uniref:hypothetical protein n=1 Tax=Streptomyces lomondensis TaxID=68229 RepID=UPI001E2F4E24|nr:hypothetical protein [Streptomyces lomondensis]MCF0076386.1 hypothetical protein [Streptomyces lomondensis]
MNRAAKVGIAGTCTALLVLGGYGADNIVHGLRSEATGDVQTKAAHSFDPATVSSSPPRTPRPSS